MAPIEVVLFKHIDDDTKQIVDIIKFNLELSEAGKSTGNAEQILKALINMFDSGQADSMELYT